MEGRTQRPQREERERLTESAEDRRNEEQKGVGVGETGYDGACPQRN
jgi:hypothetical protein